MATLEDRVQAAVLFLTLFQFVFFFKADGLQESKLVFNIKVDVHEVRLVVFRFLTLFKVNIEVVLSFDSGTLFVLYFFLEGLLLLGEGLSWRKVVGDAGRI